MTTGAPLSVEALSTTFSEELDRLGEALDVGWLGAGVSAVSVVTAEVDGLADTLHASRLADTLDTSKLAEADALHTSRLADTLDTSLLVDALLTSRLADTLHKSRLADTLHTSRPLTGESERRAPLRGELETLGVLGETVE